LLTRGQTSFSHTKDTAIPYSVLEEIKKAAPVKMCKVQGARREITMLILGTHTETKEPVTVGNTARESGFVLFGKQGSGKSSLIEGCVYQDACQDQAIFVIDPHYDLINNCIAQLPAHRLKDTYLLDMTDTEYPFAINFVDGTGLTDVTQAVDLAMSVFKKIFPGNNEQRLLNKVLKMISYTLLYNPGSTISDIPHILKDEDTRSAFVKQVHNRHVCDYWLRDYQAMSPAKRATETYALDNRLPDLLTNSLLENIIAQAHSTIDFRKSIDKKEIILIRLPVDDYPETAQIIGTMLIAEIYRAAFSYTDTPREERPGFSVYIDEFQEFVTADIGRMFTNLRKFGCKLCVATQYRDKIEGANKDAVMTANIKVSLSLTPTDARDFASLYLDHTKQPKLKQLYWDVLNRLGKHESEWIYKFNENVVKRIIEIAKDDDYTYYEDAKRAVPILEKLLIETQKQGVIPDGLLNRYLTAMEWWYEYNPPSPIFYTKERLEIKEDEYKMLTEKCLALCQEQIDNKEQDDEAVTYINELVKQIDALDKDISIYRSEIFKHEGEKRDREKKRKRMEAYTRRVLQELLRSPIGEYEKPETATDMAMKLSRLPERYGFVRIGGTIGVILNK